MWCQLACLLVYHHRHHHLFLKPKIYAAHFEYNFEPRFYKLTTAVVVVVVVAYKFMWVNNNNTRSITKRT
jgi:hypothetical protein